MTSAARFRAIPIAAVLAALVLAALGTVTAAAPPAAGATQRVVAPNGSDGGPGTADLPWRTLGHALRTVEPGDELLVRGGTYTEDLARVHYRNRATSPSAPIRVAAWPGERPVVVGQWHIRDASWWTFEGFAIRWPSAPREPGEPLVKLMGGTGWTFRGNEVAGALAYAGVYVGMSTETGTPRDWALTDNCVHSTRGRGGSGGATDHNVYVQTGIRGGAGLIEGNLLYGAPNGTNLKLGSGADSSSPSAGNVTVRYNTMFDATQNLLVEHDVHDVLIERNILGRVTAKADEYGNLRGHGVRGSTVVARDNVAWWAARLIFNTLPLSTTPATSGGIVDGGGNRFGADPRFDGVASCGQFRPSHGAAIAYGHRARVERVAGPSRAATAVALSRSVRPTGTARTALIARADAYPDALTGAPLAQKLGAPLLLTGRDRLDPVVAAELDRLRVREVVVLGGQAAVSDGVIRELQARSSVQEVRRIAGSDRFDTARRIAEEVGGTDVYVVEGASADPNRGWPDAVSVSGLAARQQRPILLVTTGLLPDGTRSALERLGAQRATVVGGTGAVSNGVERAVRDALSGPQQVTRVAGRTRYATSVEVAELAIADGARPASTWIATGQNWPDALAAGPAAAAAGGILILSPGTVPDATTGTTAFLRTTVPAGAVPRIVGGTGAITAPVEDRLAAAVPVR